ncbi:type II secretion system F family protein [Litorimonas sp. RW-G-Af-16]|uniref:type II secretion system F family protein n=1 Tax=Litorimonas sp. RW-G-Af-16 TaxID=3241168 RepID=UPI00390CB0C4
MEISQNMVIYLLVFAAGFLAVQTTIGAGRQATTRIKLANDRLRRMQGGDSQANIVAQMRKSRGLTSDGMNFRSLNDWLGQLVLQSGLPLGAYGIYVALVGFSISLALTLFLVKGGLIWALVGAGLGLVAPIFILRFLVKRRRNKAVGQLPEALDVIIRSLAAGHPVPVSMALVAREMPDPIGSEFGIASDEVSFGSTISAAVQRLSDRVGHEDFELFSAMIRLQERTGGNLAELLRSNADTIRARQKMRLKVKAASAEGRMSAIILNFAPIALFVLIQVLSPEFYGEVADRPVVKYTLWGVVVWMGIGNLVMRKMINFKI